MRVDAKSDQGSLGDVSRGESCEDRVTEDITINFIHLARYAGQCEAIYASGVLIGSVSLPHKMVNIWNIR